MFKFKTYLPALKEYVYARQFTSREHMYITKTVKNDDAVMIRQMYEYIFKECVDTDILFNDMYRVDLFCLLLNIRIMSLSEKLSLMYGTGEGRKNLNIDLYTVLDLITNYDVEHIHRIKINDDTSVVVTTPRDLITNTEMESLTNVFNTIEINNQSITISELNDDQREKIINLIPLKKLKQIESQREKSIGLSVPVIPHSVTQENDVEMNITLFGPSMYEFLKLCYMGNLQDLYNIRYILTKRCNIDVSYIETCPPTDIDALLSLYKEEIEEQKKAQAKQSGRNVSLPAQEFVQ